MPPTLTRIPQADIEDHAIGAAHCGIVATFSAISIALSTSTTSEPVTADRLLHKTSLGPLIDDVDGAASTVGLTEDGDGHIPHWQIVKARIVERLLQLHATVRHGTFIGSKVKLPIDNTRPMELDLIGEHEGGIFILELKVDRGAERNAFSELFAYSNYVAQMFAMSGPRDITNVLVANLDAKITREAYLYDLLIGNRDVIVYKPVFADDSLESLRLQLHIPADEDFQHLTNRLLSEQSMACIVGSFDDAPGWFDNREVDGALNQHTRENLERLSGHLAQLMEAEGLHGFCYVRKHWREVTLSDRSSLILCAVNPFKAADHDLSDPLLQQIDEDHRVSMFEAADFAFQDRLLVTMRRALEDCLPHGHRFDRETPARSGMVRSMIETVLTHNFGFHATGLFREAYAANLSRLYERRAAGEDVDDVSTMKAIELGNWLRAWMFIEACGFVGENSTRAD